MAIITVTKTNFEHEVLHSAMPVVIDVYSATCHSCRVNNDIINRLSETRDDIKFGRFDIDEEQALTEEFEITSVPAVLVFKDGKLAARAFGPRSKNSILGLLEL